MCSVSAHHNIIIIETAWYIFLFHFESVKVFQQCMNYVSLYAPPFYLSARMPIRNMTVSDCHFQLSLKPIFNLFASFFFVNPKKQISFWKQTALVSIISFPIQEHNMVALNRLYVLSLWSPRLTQYQVARNWKILDLKKTK